MPSTIFVPRFISRQPRRIRQRLPFSSAFATSSAPLRPSDRPISLLLSPPSASKKMPKVSFHPPSSSRSILRPEEEEGLVSPSPNFIFSRGTILFRRDCASRRSLRVRCQNFNDIRETTSPPGIPAFRSARGFARFRRVEGIASIACSRERVPGSDQSRYYVVQIPLRPVSFGT